MEKHPTFYNGKCRNEAKAMHLTCRQKRLPTHAILKGNFIRIAESSLSLNPSFSYDEYWMISSIQTVLTLLVQYRVLIDLFNSLIYYVHMRFEWLKGTVYDIAFTLMVKPLVYGPSVSRSIVALPFYQSLKQSGYNKIEESEVTPFSSSILYYSQINELWNLLYYKWIIIIIINCMWNY